MFRERNSCVDKCSTFQLFTSSSVYIYILPSQGQEHLLYRIACICQLRTSNQKLRSLPFRIFHNWNSEKHTRMVVSPKGKQYEEVTHFSTKANMPRTHYAGWHARKSLSSRKNDNKNDQQTYHIPN